MPPAAPLSEGAILLLLAAVHFANLVDFMMVMPMGPDFAGMLGIPMSQLGLVGSAYTWASFGAGLAGVRLLDRWPRRSALVWTTLGLGLSTLAAAAANGLPALLAARAAAGLFGGLAGTLCFSIVVDVVPEERRGRGLSLLSAAFALSSTLGVPLGLYLSRTGGWRMPFLAVGGALLLLAAACRRALPPLRDHLDDPGPRRRLSLDQGLLLSLLAFALAVFGNFMLIPNLSAFVQFNLDFPRERLGLLYMVGGLATLAAVRAGGAWTDRVGAQLPVAVTSVAVASALLLGLREPPLLAPLLFFPLYMGANAVRWMVIYNLASRLPPPNARAGFLSLQTAAGHAFAGLGAWTSTRFLTADPSGRLYGLQGLALAAVFMGLMVPLVVRRLEDHARRLA